MSKQLGLRRLGGFVSTSLLAAALIMPSTGSIAHAEDEAPILTDSSLGSAVMVEVEPRCSQIQFRSPEVKIRWSMNASVVEGGADSDDLLSATEFRVDLSKYHNGLATGRLDSVAVQTSAQTAAGGNETKRSEVSSVVVADLRPGVYYHARVLVRTPEGWVPSAPTGFLSLACPVDGLDRE